MAQRGGGGFNPGMMKQIQQLQARIEQAQKELQELVVETTAGGGAIKVSMNAEPKLESITIDPEVVDPEDVEMLQDLVLAAVNDALQKIKDEQNRRMSGLTGGLNIPGLT